MADNDYAGEILTMESFTAQTTDGSGDIDVVLQNTPVADDAIVVQLQGVAGAFAQVQSRSGTTLTVRVYQKYDKTTAVDGTGSLTDLPSSVTEDSTAGGPTISSSSVSGVGSSSAGGGNQSLWTQTHSHTTQINKVITHGHDTLTQEATALSTLNSTGGITITVMYAF